MPNICLCFQIHTPIFLKSYNFFDLGYVHDYFDEDRTVEYLSQLSEESFLPANTLFEELFEKYGGSFRIGMVISGVSLTLLEKYRPDVLRSFQKLIDKGNVELLAQNNDFSLSFMYDREEYQRQLDIYQARIQKLFHQTPKVIATAAGLYSNPMGYYLQKQGYQGILCGEDVGALKGRSVHQLYHPVHLENMKLLFANEEMCRAIETDFAINNLDAHGFADWLANSLGEIVHLYLDYEILGHKRPISSGIFDFFRNFPKAILKNDDTHFVTPSEIFQNATPRESYDMSRFSVRNQNLQSYCSNFLQQEALTKLYELKKSIQNTADTHLINTWQQLQSANYFQAMGYESIWGQNAETNYSRFLNIISDIQELLKTQYLVEQPSTSN